MSNKIKVLFFVDRMRHGGIQQFLVENVKHIDKSQFDIDVLTLDDGIEYPLEKAIKDAGANFYKLDGIWIKTPMSYIRYSRALKQFFGEHEGYDIIHMNASSKNYILLKYAKKYGVPIRIVHSHNTGFQTKSLLKRAIGNILKKPLMKYATDYFACSKLAGAWLFGKKAVQAEKVKIIHNAVDYKAFCFNEETRRRIRKEYSINDDELLIGHVGRFTKQKNHSFLVDIFNEMRNSNSKVKMILVGVGEGEEEIRNKVKDLGISDKVIFAGYKQNVNELMQAMDIFLLPSLYEGLPVVGIEAQAAGLPSYTSKGVVTSETKVSEALSFISLDESAKVWADSILNGRRDRIDTKKDLSAAGYIIEDSVKELERYYRMRVGQ